MKYATADAIYSSGDITIGWESAKYVKQKTGLKQAENMLKIVVYSLVELPNTFFMGKNSERDEAVFFEHERAPVEPNTEKSVHAYFVVSMFYWVS